MLTFNGAPTRALHGSAWHVERFNTGQLPAGWVDASVLLGTDEFDPPTFSNGRLEAQATHPDGYSLSPDPNIRCGHTFIGVDTGLDDNFELRIRWVIPSFFAAYQQVSPVAFVDFNAADPKQLGVLPVWDSTIPTTGAFYLQNAFRNPVDEAFDTALYDQLGDAQSASVLDLAPITTISLRCENGELNYSYNGKADDPETTVVPEWAEGRTWMGVHIVSIDWVNEYPPPIGGTVESATPAIVDCWQVRSLA